MGADAYPASPRRDLASGLAWVALGSAIVALSWAMDRMTAHGASAYTAPGLWPGMVGLTLAALGGALVVRSMRRASRIGWDAAEHDDTPYAPVGSFALAAGLFLVYALLLVGRGLPFWLGTALFVTAFVWLFQFARHRAEGRPVRGAVVALACGALTSLAVTLLFEQVFYVRLP